MNETEEIVSLMDEVLARVWDQGYEARASEEESEWTEHEAIFRNSIPNPYRVNHVEIGGQRMTEDQFNAARFPLVSPDPGEAVEIRG